MNIDFWIHKKRFDEWLKNNPDAGKELNSNGDLLLTDEYSELKQSDTKDYYREAIQ